MKTTIVRLVVAVALGAAAWACWREAALTTRVAEAKQRLATLQLGVDDGLVPVASLSDYAPGMTPLSDEIREQRATVEYWLGRYEDVMQVDREQGDATLLRLAANAAFREAQRQGGAGEEAAQRLDAVMQAYVTVLKASPQDFDAAYNYELIARLRDVVAELPAPRPGGKPAPGKPVPPPPPAVSLGDGRLPAGPTVHGWPGGPPKEVKGEPFEILAPMEFGEREAQPTGTPGGDLKKKG